MDPTFENIISLEKKRVCAKMYGKKLSKNIANFGIKKDGIATVERNGEYHGLSIQALDDVLPLFTNYRIAHAIKYLESGDIISAMNMLYVKNTHEMYYILFNWLKKYNFKITDAIQHNYGKIILKEINKNILDQRLENDRATPIPCKLRIVDIGSSKGHHSVVPDSWIGKEFKSGSDLHQHMDELEWRRDKPKVNYCCVYGMIINDTNVWITYETACKIYPTYGIIISHESGKINAKYYDFSSNKNIEMVDEKKYENWLKSNHIETYDILNGKKFIVACHKKLLFNDETVYGKNENNVGYLVSCIQKCIRRGSVCSTLLCKVIKQLNKSKPYNLPEHNYMRVSGTKQLLWRLFITTIEDSSIYKCNISSMFSLELIYALSVLCHIDSSLQLKDENIQILCHTALIIQSFKNHWEWRKGNVKKISSTEIQKFTDDEISNAIKFAILHTPMMRGDNEMLTKSIDRIKTFEIPIIKNVSPDLIKEILKLSDDEKEYECQCESYDMHCFPNIILLVQGSTKKQRDKTTRDIPHIIWDYISRNNFRYDINYPESSVDNDIVSTTREIQKYIFNNGTKNIDYVKHDTLDKTIIPIFSKLVKQSKSYIDENMDVFNKRTAFLLLFGKKMHMTSVGKFKSVDVIVGGDINYPLKIKRVSTKNKYEYMVGEEKYEYERKFIETLDQPIKINLPNAIPSYEWKFDKSYVYIQIKIDKSDNINKINSFSFYVNDEKIDAFDGHKLMLKMPKSETMKHNDVIDKLIEQSMYNKKYISNDFEINLITRYVWKIRNECHHYSIMNWIRDNNIPIDVWKIINSRLISNNNLTTGPVDRGGNKTLNAISYEYEGCIWRIMNMLSMIYPETIHINGLLNFKIDKNTSGYQHLLDSIQSLQVYDNDKITDKKNDTKKHRNVKIDVPKITTELWEHQKSSSSRIYDGIINLHKKGHADASHVGSGKTLIALTVITKLLKYQSKNRITHTGVLILLPTEKLYKTWDDEIEKHTKKFNVCHQYADGHLDSEIQYNTILITTLGRMRDHPLIHKWLYVVIDECLSVQNSTSLHTNEAWRQVSNSQFGVLLLSATFFRSRFDKLLYMLKMLRTELPLEIEYLDTILNECLVCYISENSRKWYTNIHRFDLSKDIQKEYDKIINSDDSYEIRYTRITSLMFKKCDYMKCFSDVIKTIGNRKALIYARSKDEADEISDNIKNVSRYPDKSKKHVVLSYTEGTYGLNDLVIYDTIITRICDTDRIPQMKGRLDRPNQKSDVLHIEYFFYENTIEEMNLYKLEMAKKFNGQYIIPLAQFYRLAIDKFRK